MESVICRVKDIETAGRRALEHVVGRHLADNQQLVIHVVNAEVSSTRDVTSSDAVRLPDWCNVYEGLSDEDVSDLEDVLLTRADLSRDAE